MNPNPVALHITAAQESVCQHTQIACNSFLRSWKHLRPLNTLSRNSLPKDTVAAQAIVQLHSSFISSMTALKGHCSIAWLETVEYRD